MSRPDPYSSYSYLFPIHFELENIIERAVVFSRGEYITKEDLPVSIIQRSQKKVEGKLNETIEKIEQEMILEALNKNNWNQTKSAANLGISERVLRYKMNKYKIKKHDN